MASANRQFYFFSNLDNFYFCSCLIALARTFSIMLNRSGGSGRHYLVPDLRGKAFCFSLLSIRLAYHILSLLCCSTFLLYPVCWVFIMKVCWILSNAFSASVEMSTWFLSFILLMLCITFINLHMLNHPLHPRAKSNLIIVYDPYNVLSNSLC